MRRRRIKKDRNERWSKQDLESAVGDLQWKVQSVYKEQPEVLVNSLLAVGGLSGALLFIACISGFRGALELIFEGGLMTLVTVVFFASTGAAFYLKRMTETVLLDDEASPDRIPYDR